LKHEKADTFFSISTFLRASLLFMLLTAGVVHRVDATVYYVHSSGNDGNSGTSWEQAFQTLQKALEATAPNDEIWVASGTYLPAKNSLGNPSPADPRTKTFLSTRTSGSTETSAARSPAATSGTGPPTSPS
jgi:hypothetical protein